MFYILRHVLQCIGGYCMKYKYKLTNNSKLSTD